MSYNVLNLPDGSIEGHKYVKGILGSAMIASHFTVTSSTPYTYTTTADGIFNINFSKSTGGNTMFIHVNSVWAATWVSFNTPNAGVIQLPVKKGDVINISCDGSTWNIEAVYMMEYR